jgi:hypothetical protein
MYSAPKLHGFSLPCPLERLLISVALSLTTACLLLLMHLFQPIWTSTPEDAGYPFLLVWNCGVQRAYGGLLIGSWQFRCRYCLCVLREHLQI